MIISYKLKEEGKRTRSFTRLDSFQKVQSQLIKENKLFKVWKESMFDF